MTVALAVDEVRGLRDLYMVAARVVIDWTNAVGPESRIDVAPIPAATA